MRSLLAVLCPPVAVLSTGRPLAAVGNLTLTLLGFVPGVVHALIVVDRHAVDRRNAALLDAVGRFYGC